MSGVTVPPPVRVWTRTQLKIAEAIGSPSSYVNRLIKKTGGIINKTFIQMMEALGYDVELRYIKREEKTK